MSAYTGWAPQEFDEAAMNAAADTQNGNSAVERQEQGEPGPDTGQSSDFQYDSTSGTPHVQHKLAAHKPGKRLK